MVLVTIKQKRVSVTTAIGNKGELTATCFAVAEDLVSLEVDPIDKDAGGLILTFELGPARVAGGNTAKTLVRAGKATTSKLAVAT